MFIEVRELYPVTMDGIEMENGYKDASVCVGDIMSVVSFPYKIVDKPDVNCLGAKILLSGPLALFVRETHNDVMAMIKEVTQEK